MKLGLNISIFVFCIILGSTTQIQARSCVEPPTDGDSDQKVAEFIYRILGLENHEWLFVGTLREPKKGPASTRPIVKYNKETVKNAGDRGFWQSADVPILSAYIFEGSIYLPDEVLAVSEMEIDHDFRCTNDDGLTCDQLLPYGEIIAFSPDVLIEAQSHVRLNAGKICWSHIRWEPAGEVLGLIHQRMNDG